VWHVFLLFEGLSKFYFWNFSSPAAREIFTFHPTASIRCGISPNECSPYLLAQQGSCKPLPKCQSMQSAPAPVPVQRAAAAGLASGRGNVNEESFLGISISGLRD
jgi:hypothetical protein